MYCLSLTDVSFIPWKGMKHEKACNSFIIDLYYMY